MSILKLLYKDYCEYGKYSRFGIITLLNINFHININFRLSHLFYKIKLYPLAKIFWLFNRILFSVDIEPGANLAGGFVIIHGIGLVIGKYVESLGPLKVYHGATIGANSLKANEVDGKKITMPKIDSNVIVGINSVVIGPIYIGKDARIGSNAVVTKDVEQDAIIVGVNRNINIPK